MFTAKASISLYNPRNVIKLTFPGVISCRMILMARSLLSLLAGGAMLLPATALSSSRKPGEPIVERIVIVMRHGIRAPLASEVPQGTRIATPWPRWPVEESRLTPHGIRALETVAAADRRRFIALGVLPRGCAAPGAIRIRTNVSDRTIASGEAYARGIAPGCGLAAEHLEAGAIDPIFEPLRAGATRFDANRAVAEIERFTGGMRALAARHADTIALLDRILGCAPRGTGCTPDAPARVSPSPDGRGIELQGPIRDTSGIAQVLLLQYVEGLPLRDVGWGRADPAALTRIGALHAALFDVFTRSPYMASHQAAVLGRHVMEKLADPRGPRIEVLMGHDTNVTALGAVLRTSLRAPGYAVDDVPPGGAILIERLRDRKSGRRYVRLSYRTQSPQALRSGSAAASIRPLTMAGCTHLCPADRFTQLLQSRLAE